MAMERDRIGAGMEVLPLDYAAPSRVSQFRWMILGLLFLATTINYVDRMVLGILAPTLQKQYHISEKAYGNINMAFGLAYAVGQLVSGKVLDTIGTRIGYAVALVAWSLSAACHALARTAMGFGVMRAFLGLSESPNFPAAVKTVAEWFPRRERALAMGVVNAGSNVGAVLAPAVVPWLATSYGWQWAFIGTASMGVLWLALWLPIYRRPHEHPRVSPAELAHINSDPPEPATTVPWLALLGYRQTWAFAVGKFLTDPIWWFFLMWFAKFLDTRYGVPLTKLSLPMITVYLMADVGSVGGGWLSSSLIARGFGTNMARKAALLACALCVVPVVFATGLSNMWLAVVLVGLAVAAHQGFSSNLYTLVSDTFPKQAVGSVCGLGGMFGYLGVSLFSLITGQVLGWTHGRYTGLFAVAGSVYLVAFAAIHLLIPRLEPAKIGGVGGAEGRGFEVLGLRPQTTDPESEI